MSIVTISLTKHPVVHLDRHRVRHLQRILQHLGTLVQRLDLIQQVLLESAPFPQLDRPDTPVLDVIPLKESDRRRMKMPLSKSSEKELKVKTKYGNLIPYLCPWGWCCRTRNS